MIIYPYKFITYPNFIYEYTYTIYILKFTDPSDICGRSGRFVNPIIFVYTCIYTFDIFVRSR